MINSQAVIKPLRFNQMNYKLVRECLGRLNMLSSNNKVWMLTVAGRIETEINKVRTSLAGKAQGRLYPDKNPSVNPLLA